MMISTVIIHEPSSPLPSAFPRRQLMQEQQDLQKRAEEQMVGGSGGADSPTEGFSRRKAGNTKTLKDSYQAKGFLAYNSDF